jgi:Kef-type K+ transport system membrane component KefB
MQSLITIGIIILTGFIFGEIANKIKLPKVTGYICAGILLNPSLFNIIPKDFVIHTDLVTNIALCFITFSVGGTLFYSHIKRLGKGISYITIFEAECAFLVVILGFLLLSPIFIHSPGASWLATFIPISILIGSLASPTDPTATLAVVHEYKAKGDVTSTIMGIAALDDALGIINYSIAIAVAGVLILHVNFSVYSLLLRPLIVIIGAVLLGIGFGFILNWLTSITKKETEGTLIVLLLALLSLCFGSAKLLGIDELLATMTMGVVVVNFNPLREKIFKILERYTEELIFVLFFTLSGMHLKFSVLVTYYMLILLFVLFRTIGKVSGVMLGAVISRSGENIRKYTAGGLIPQGGIVIGLALMIKQNTAFEAISDIIISIIIGATVIHELIGPISSKIALKKAGEIK